MKKLIPFLMLIPFLGVAQLQKTKLSTMVNAPTGTVHIVASNPLNGVQNYSTTAQLGLLTNKDSLSINGVVKSLFGKPSFTVSVPTETQTLQSVINPANAIQNNPNKYDCYNNWIDNSIMAVNVGNGITQNYSFISSSGNLIPSPVGNSSWLAIGTDAANESQLTLQSNTSGYNDIITINSLNGLNIKKSNNSDTLFNVDRVNNIVTYKGNEISVSTASTTVLTASTGIALTGSAPSYTITNSLPNITQSLSISTNTISLSGGGGSITIPTGSTTVLTASTNITVSGSAPNYTISAPTQTAGLQPALTASTNITINSNTISAASPTITAGSNMSVTTSGLNYTVAATTQTAGLISLSSLSATAPLSYNNSTGSFTITPSFTNTALNGTTTLTGAINHSMTASSASSATVNLAAWTGNYGHITGTVTITNFGTVQAGAQRIITFDGALTVTSNTAAIILPGNSNIATAANDVMMLVSEGSGVWRCTSYMRADESYTNYTPSWTGFSSTPTITAGDARYKMISKNTCHVIIWVTTAGTSNTNALTVTLPFTAASTGGGGNGLQQSVMGVLNNGVQVNGSVRSRASSSNILDCYNGIVGATFTTSGSKGVFLNYIYQTE